MFFYSILQRYQLVLRGILVQFRDYYYILDHLSTVRQLLYIYYLSDNPVSGHGLVVECCWPSIYFCDTATLLSHISSLSPATPDRISPVLQPLQLEDDQSGWGRLAGVLPPLDFSQQSRLDLAKICTIQHRQLGCNVTPPPSQPLGGYFLLGTVFTLTVQCPLLLLLQYPPVPSYGQEEEIFVL